MAGLLVLAALLVLLAMCGVRGWGTDSRHPAFSAGRLIEPRPEDGDRP